MLRSSGRTKAPGKVRTSSCAYDFVNSVHELTFKRFVLLFIFVDMANAGGIYQIRLQFPDQYPDKAPRVRFTTEMFHPNVSAGQTRSFRRQFRLASFSRTSAAMLTLGAFGGASCSPPRRSSLTETCALTSSRTNGSLFTRLE